MKTITLNGHSILVAVHTISFEYLVATAFGDMALPSDYVINYRGSSFDSGYVGGQLSEGDKLIPADRMAIVVKKKE